MVLSKDMKMSICFGLIVGALISFCCLCLAAEVEDVELILIDNLDITSNTGAFVNGVDGYFKAGSASYGYIPIEGGYSYTFTNNGTGTANNRVIVFSNELPSSGVSWFDLLRLGASQSVTFNSSDFSYVFVDVSNPSLISVTRTKIDDFSGFIDNLAFTLSFGNLNSVWLIVVPILAISVLFGLGFYFIKRIMYKTKRAKGGM